MDKNTKIYINPTGRFVVGGPHGDAGVTGRKIIVDTYGGAAPHGGGAFSGKDPTKVDRSACYMARYIAKNVVAAGLAERALVQLAYAIGVADPVSVMVDTEGTGRIDDEQITELVREHFKLTPRGIMEELDLRRPIYKKTAAFGHFGRTEPEFTWERTDKAAALKSAAEAARPLTSRPVKTCALLATAALVAAVAVLVGVALPPRRCSSLAPTPARRHRSPARCTSTPTDPTAAALPTRSPPPRRAPACKFVVFTDHGDATRTPDPPAYRSGVLCLDGVEISTNGGHYIALDLPRRAVSARRRAARRGRRRAPARRIRRRRASGFAESRAGVARLERADRRRRTHQSRYGLAGLRWHSPAGGPKRDC